MKEAKIEMLEALGLQFIDKLQKGDMFYIKKDTKPEFDLVTFESYSITFINFDYNGKICGVFWKDVQAGKVSIKPF